MVLKGQYGVIKCRGRQVGGFFYWNYTEKPPRSFWTSDWWLMDDVKEGEVELFRVNKNVMEEVNNERMYKVKLVYPHTLILNQRMKGVLQMIVK